MLLVVENEDILVFWCNIYILVYGEGWVFYFEKLGEEMGMYYMFYEIFGMLSY